ncbi:MAG: N-6 DNA methylase [Candidatus Cloacimonetes bacterium]|nr:N-6 DNA methylase [Candidatus Cloacimonadota bacterium]
MADFKTYLEALKQNKPDEITEHTLRPELQSLLNSFKDEKNPQIRVLHEPKRHADYGAPDFKLALHEGILGYVENKALGADLTPVLKTTQIERYKKLSDNILLTNYLDWIWIKEGKNLTRVSLCTLDELYRHKFTPDPARLEEVSKLIRNFLSSAPEGIDKPKALAEALGQRGKLLKDYLWDELKRQEETDNEGKLFGLYNTFKEMVDHELKLEDFTDTFAQMLVYGLFMARLNSEGAKIDLNNVEQFIPTSFELIQELVGFLKELNRPEYSETRWIVEEVLAILNTMNLGSILKALSFDKRNKIADPETAKDPYIYFYEDFLAAYDKKLRKKRGVYYTPPPVVNFIIRAVNDVLKDTFGIAEGLADHKKVTLLDFACGTGTFLLETIRQILDATPVAKRDLIIKEHILKNLYGFEYMIAPYTVAHLKLTQYLKDRGYDLQEHERFKVFLTNTLEHFEAESEMLLPALSTESKNAKGAKDKPILVITGNPPYSYVSKNNGDWIKKLMKDYYFCDGKPLGERNSKGLQDDYVKFIRFAQWKIDQAEEGIVAIITNHSFLDNPTFRGMRQSLIRTFNQMYFLDLHGNAKKKETAPDGSKDENVFDIMQGVCISILIKTTKPLMIKTSDLHGVRLDKYKYLSQRTLSDVEWNTLSGKTSHFAQQSNGYCTTYTQFVGLHDIYCVSNIGITTSKDTFTIRWTEKDLNEHITKFLETDDETARQCFDLGDDTDSWSIKQAKNDLLRNNPFRDKYTKILYRPFDFRYTFYSGKSNGFISRPRSEVMGHLLQENLSLIAPRINRQISVGYCYVSSCIVERHVLDNAKDATYVFPLYLYEESDFLGDKHFDKKPNIKPEIFQLLKARYAAQNTAEITPEIIMGYIYAVLHSPSYREKYKDFLKTDFPRIPFCEDFATFEQMSALGWQLINAHLMKSEELKQRYPGLGAYSVKGDNDVSKVFYTESLQRLSINDTQYFDAIPEPVYRFHIGGYQVLNKYLKDRKGRTLTLDEINSVEFIAKILAFTMDTMLEIDTISKAWI